MKNKMNTYSHTGTGGIVRARTIEHAADILARREFGRRGYAATLRLESYAADGSSHTYQAFIGVADGDGTTGHNIWIYA